MSRLRDRYELVGELGAGGMGVVREAIDHEQQRRVALKSVRAVTPDRLRRFKHEFRVARDLHHPNLVRLGELFEDHGDWFFTMELVRGVDLLAHVRGLDPGDVLITDETTHTLQLRPGTDGGAAQRPATATGRCDPDRLRAALIQLARALDALHRAGLVHRDVKPSNVLVDADGRVVLFDFGIAEQAGTQEDRDKVVGTAGYMAPEQIEGPTIGPAADWYAVGSLMFAALTGRHPFTGGARDVLAAKTKRDGPAPSTIAAGVPRDLDRLCERLLALDPAIRPGAADVLAALGAEAEPAAPPAATFVGRAALLDGLDLARDAARDAATLIVLEGDAGIGKTALAAQAIARWQAADPSLLVLRGRCHEREAIPYNALDGVVDDLGRALARLPAITRDALAGDALEALAWLFPTLPADRTAPAADPVTARRRAFAALRVVLDRVAARAPLVLAIDDLHWADADSVAALDALLSPPAAPRLLLLATVRASADRPWIPPGALAGATRIAMTGLDADDVARLAGAFGRADVDLAQLARDTGGNPMLLEQWLSLPGGDGAPRPGALDDVVAARRARLSPAAGEVLEVVAVATREVPQAAVAAVASLDPEVFDAAIAELTAARFARIAGTRPVDPVEAAHDRIRAHVYAAIPPARRAVLHGRLADALIDGGGAPEAIATQLVAAGQPARASRYARAAAEIAERALAFDRAADLYRVAIAGAPDAPALHARLGDALASAGRPEDAAAAYLAASHASGGALELRRRAAEQHLAGGYLDRGLVAIRAILEETGGGRVPRTDAGAIASLIWNRARLALRRLRWTPRTEDEVGAATLTRLDVHWSVSIGLALTDSLRGAVFAVKLPLLCLPHGEELRIARALCAASVAHAGMGLRRPARRLLAATERAAAAHGSPLARFYAAFGQLGLAFLVDNDWRETLATCERARALWHEAGRGRGWELDTVEQFGCFAELWLGRYRAIEARVDTLARHAADAGNRFQEVGLRTYFASLTTLLGEPDRGEAQVADALARWTIASSGSAGARSTASAVHSTIDRPDSNQAYWGLRSTTYAAMYRGDVDAAAARLDPAWRRLRGSLLLRVPSVAAEAYAALGGYLVTRATLARAPVERARHLAAARKVGKRLARSKMSGGRMAHLALAAGIAHLEGDDSRAISLLRDAEVQFEAAGMDALLAACRLRLGALVGDDALRAAGLAWFTRERIPDPDRTASLLSPGWHPDARETP